MAVVGGLLLLLLMSFGYFGYWCKWGVFLFGGRHVSLVEGLVFIYPRTEQLVIASHGFAYFRRTDIGDSIIAYNDRIQMPIVPCCISSRR